MPNDLAEYHDLPEDDDFELIMSEIQDGLSTSNRDVSRTESSYVNPFEDPDDEFTTFMDNTVKDYQKEVPIREIKVDGGQVDKALDFQKQIESKRKEASEPTPTSITQNQIEILFQFAKENDILHIPDGVELNSENLEGIKQYNKDLQLQAALEFIKDSAGDSTMAQVIELAWNGGTLEDIEQAKDIIYDESVLDKMDINNQEVQRRLLTQFYKEGLDPKIPSHRYALDDIENKVETIIEKYDAKKEAKKALDYFKDQIFEAKSQLQQEIAGRKVREEKEAALKYQKEVNWRQNFIKNVVDSNWAVDKKNEVVSQFDTVKLTNGQELPLWDYKLKKIWENPNLTKELFKFLADLDPMKLEFKNHGINPKNEATNLVLQMANKKVSNRSNSFMKEVNRETSKDGKPVIPEERFYDFIEKFGE